MFEDPSSQKLSLLHHYFCNKESTMNETSIVLQYPRCPLSKAILGNLMINIDGNRLPRYLTSFLGMPHAVALELYLFFRHLCYYWAVRVYPSSITFGFFFIDNFIWFKCKVKNLTVAFRLLSSQPGTLSRLSAASSSSSLCLHLFSSS